MKDQRQIPPALSVVSYLFLVIGILGAFGIVESLMRGKFPLHPDVLGLWIFWGLRRYSRVWRGWALVLICFYLIAIPLGIARLLYIGEAIHIRLSDQKIVEIPLAWFLPVVGLLFMLAIWQYRVLMRPDIRRFFNVEPKPPAA